VDLVAGPLSGIRSDINAALDAGVEEIVLNLAYVGMLDSTGIGLLYKVYAALNQRGGRLTIEHASEDVLDLLRMVRMHEILSVSGR
jgi:anti-anti-sigma factor